MKPKNILILLLFQASALFAQKDRKLNDFIINKIKPFIREGDVIFRNGASKETALIRTFAVGAAVFSHCGIVVKNRSGMLVVLHVMGGTGNADNDLFADTFEEFVSDSATLRLVLPGTISHAQNVPGWVFMRIRFFSVGFVSIINSLSNRKINSIAPN